MPRKSRYDNCCDPKAYVICQNVLSENSQLRCEYHSSIIFDSPIKKVQQENRRARSKNLQADLTFHQWTTALDFFHGNLPNGMIVWCCAYCGRYVGFDIGIDHWEPMIAGGGTNVENCVPCCATCNFAKNVLSGDEFFNYLIDAYKSPVAARQYKRAQKYFQLLKQGTPIKNYLDKENQILDFIEQNAEMLPPPSENDEAKLLDTVLILREMREIGKLWDGVDVQDYVENFGYRARNQETG